MVARGGVCPSRSRKAGGVVSQEQPNNPLHGITLKAVLEDLLERHGWDELGARVNIRCFQVDPSIKSRG